MVIVAMRAYHSVCFLVAWVQWTSIIVLHGVCLEKLSQGP